MDLIAFGTVFLEIVFGQVPALPGPGEEIYADEFAISCGGGAVTVASAATRLGVRAGMSALLGEDLGSRVVEEHCRQRGVDLSPSRHVPGHVAGISVVLNFDADRAFVSYVPPRPPAERPDRERWLDVLREYRPAWCYLHAGTETCGLLRKMRPLGVRIALDLALNDIADDRDAVLRCVREADIFLPNTEELMRLSRAGTLDAAIDAASSWCPCVVVKRGPEGATVIDRGARIDVTEGLRQVEVRDRTGAGDAFAGALIGALCNGASITEAAAAGNEAGSETVSILGAVGEVEVEGLSAAAPVLASTLARTMAGNPAAPPAGGEPDGHGGRGSS